MGNNGGVDLADIAGDVEEQTTRTEAGAKLPRTPEVLANLTSSEF